MIDPCKKLISKTLTPRIKETWEGVGRALGHSHMTIVKAPTLDQTDEFYPIFTGNPRATADAQKIIDDCRSQSVSSVSSIS
tara:strand:+ start:2192 stop:2434 length:243 start_codon:yes stop_codon:yes gene_type:complete